MLSRSSQRVQMQLESRSDASFQTIGIQIKLRKSFAFVYKSIYRREVPERFDSDIQEKYAVPVYGAPYYFKSMFKEDSQCY